MAKDMFSSMFDETVMRVVRKHSKDMKVGVNVIVERALKLYFANQDTEVWEQHQEGGWYKKMVIRKGKVTIQSVRSRRVRNFNEEIHCPEALEKHGWKRIWELGRYS